MKDHDVFCWAVGHTVRLARFETWLHQNPPLAFMGISQQLALGTESMLLISVGSGAAEVSIYATDGAEFCTIDGDTVYGAAAGTCSITETKDGDSEFRPSSDTVPVIVAPGVFSDRFED